MLDKIIRVLVGAALTGLALLVGAVLLYAAGFSDLNIDRSYGFGVGTLISSVIGLIWTAVITSE